MDKSLESSIRLAVREGFDLDSLIHLVKSVAVSEAMVMGRGSKRVASAQLKISRHTTDAYATAVPIINSKGTPYYSFNRWYANKRVQPMEDGDLVQVEYASGRLSEPDYACISRAGACAAGGSARHHARITPRTRAVSFG